MRLLPSILRRTSAPPTAPGDLPDGFLLTLQVAFCNAKQHKMKAWIAEVTSATIVLALLAVATYGDRFGAWSKWVVVFVAVVAALVEVYARRERLLARRYYTKGEHEERHELLSRGLGWDVTPTRPDAQLVDNPCVSTAVRMRARRGERLDPERVFYHFSGASGVGRLLANVGEAAAFTAGQYARMAARRSSQITAFWVTVAIATTLAFALPGERERQLADQVLVAVVAVVLLRLDLWGERASFAEASADLVRLTESVHHQLDHLGDAEILQRAVKALMDFKGITADMPVIPESVYLSVRGALNARYHETYGEQVDRILGQRARLAPT